MAEHSINLGLCIQFHWHQCPGQEIRIFGMSY